MKSHFSVHIAILLSATALCGQAIAEPDESTVERDVKVASSNRVNSATGASTASRDGAPSASTGAQGETAAPAQGASIRTGSTATPRNRIEIANVSERLNLLGSAKSDAEREARQAIVDFYSDRDNDPVWVSSTGLTTNGAAVVTEIADAESWGLDATAFELPDIAEAQGPMSPEALADLEIEVALAALTYANHARGGRVDPTDLSYDIDLKLPLKAPGEVLVELSNAADPDGYLRRLHPSASQFQLLREVYLKLTDPERVAEAKPQIDETQYAAAVREAKLAGFPPPPRPNFPKRERALPSDAQQTATILRNMEFWRWMPEDLGDTHIIVNVPEYQTHVIENGEEVFRERVVVGKRANKTPLFSDEMDHIVFNPLWNLPASIKVKELLPGLLRGGDPISRQGLKVRLGNRIVNPRSVNWARVDIRSAHVFQPSGSSNALGLMKFMFPNKHAVYMHDTPSKHLFKRQERAFSHGCIRTRNPLEFAKVVLRIGKGWSAEKTVATFESSPENNEIHLDRKIPVHIGYFTAWVDPETKRVSYFDDVYDHEKHLRYAFEGKTHLIVKSKPNVGADYQRIREAALARQEAEQGWFGGGSYSSSPWFGGGYGSSQGGSYSSSGSSSSSGWRSRAFGTHD